jgi:hypothetical protein
MPGAHENLEHAEHAAHAGGHHASGNINFGVTMAILGALVAFCAAMVGSERNELTRTLIQQTQAHADYAASSTKYRLVMLELEKQRGMMGGGSTAAGAADPPGGASDPSVIRRLIELATHYASERKIFGVWLDSYSPIVETHFDTAEDYERAQLVAEFGIVTASLAVLLGNRRIWILSVGLGVCCIGQLAFTALEARPALEKGESELRRGEAQFEDFRARYPSGAEDSATMDAVDPGGVIRKEIDNQAAKAKPGKSKPGSE